MGRASGSGARPSRPASLGQRARGCLLGLAVGDALGQRTEGWEPQAIQARWGYIEDLPPETTVVSDDTEYTLFSARVLLAHGRAMRSEDVAAAWRRDIVPQRGPFKGAGFSEMATIENLRRGLEPPLSGKHYHAWSDGLAMRVAPYAIVEAGNPTGAAALAEVDGRVSHDGEGIHTGRAVAAAIAHAMTAASVDETVDAALGVIPRDTWTARSILRGADLGQGHASARDAIDTLHGELAVDFYPWPDLAPEAAGLAFGLLQAGRGDVRGSLLAAVNLGRDSDTVAAILGAILGATYGQDAIPASWHRVAVPAEGRCLASVRGLELLDTADALAAAATGDAR